MKKILSVVLVSILLFGCSVTPRLNTEGYIKNNIENHLVNKFSEIQTFTIFQGVVNGTNQKGGGYLELVGYKYNNENGLVISSDKTGIQKKSGIIKPDGITKYFTVLSLKDCKEIIQQYETLKQKGEKSINKRKNRNTLYFDYTISDNLYISIEHVNVPLEPNHENHLHFWIRGQKYSLQSSRIIKNLTSFINWIENDN